MSERNYRSASGKATQEATLRDIVTPLFRRRRLLILCFCGIFLGRSLRLYSFEPLRSPNGHSR